MIDPSSLTKFRKLRLQDSHLLNLLIEKAIAIAMDLGLIETETIIVDATHTQSRYNCKNLKRSCRISPISCAKTSIQ